MVHTPAGGLPEHACTGEGAVTPAPVLGRAHHMLEIGSVRFVSKLRNCFPFFENPLTSVSELTNILSLGPPSEPPAARQTSHWYIPDYIERGRTEFETRNLSPWKCLEHHLQGEVE